MVEFVVQSEETIWPDRIRLCWGIRVGPDLLIVIIEVKVEYL